MHKWQVLLCRNVASAFISLILAHVPTKAAYFMSGLGGGVIPKEAIWFSLYCVL